MPNRWNERDLLRITRDCELGMRESRRSRTRIEEIAEELASTDHNGNG